jgi:hypothetical protein
MKRIAMTLALMCVVSTSIFAGEMPAGGKSEPPTPLAGNMPAGGKSEKASTTSSTSALLVSVILTALSLR